MTAPRDGRRPACGRRRWQGRQGQRERPVPAVTEIVVRAAVRRLAARRQIPPMRAGTVNPALQRARPATQHAGARPSTRRDGGARSPAVAASRPTRPSGHSRRTGGAPGSNCFPTLPLLTPFYRLGESRNRPGSRPRIDQGFARDRPGSRSRPCSPPDLRAVRGGASEPDRLDTQL